MSSPPSTAPHALVPPTELEIAPEYGLCNESDTAGTSSEPSPRSSPTGFKGENKRLRAEDIELPTPGTRPRSSARRSIAQSQAASAEDVDAASALPSPAGSASTAPLAASDASTSASPVGSALPSPLSSPERKIWMRACNNCGFELHVRRVRCTECGTVQMSKRAYAAQQEENKKAEREKIRAEEIKTEAQEAASQLALIAETSTSGAVVISHATVKPPAEVTTEAAAAAEVMLPPPSPAASSSSVVSALARLSPEQLIKLRRMQKLRALLGKLPHGVKLPPRSASKGAANAGHVTAAPATTLEGDAISMLASVACM